MTTDCARLCNLCIVSDLSDDRLIEIALSCLTLRPIPPTKFSAYLVCSKEHARAQDSHQYICFFSADPIKLLLDMDKD